MKKHRSFTLYTMLSTVAVFCGTFAPVRGAAGVMTGDGTEERPFIVEDYDDLKAVGGDSVTYTPGSVYRLASDIDGSPSHDEAAGYFTAIGKKNPFTGVFHGGGHTINDLVIHNGLFHAIDGGVVDSLGLINIASSDDSAGGGGLASMNRNGTITRCFTTGSVASRFSGSTGGLIGVNRHGTVTFCYSTCRVRGGSTMTGGLIGKNDSGSVVGNCYAAGPVRGENYIGGLIGINGESSVASCYTSGIVAPSTPFIQNYGGFVGYNRGGTITGCTAYGGVLRRGEDPDCGFCGINSSAGSISGCYWNTDASRRTEAVHTGQDSGESVITGLTNDQMKLQESFTGLDFATVWTISADCSFPVLRSIDNVPLALCDTFLSGETFSLDRFLFNDCGGLGGGDPVLRIDSINWGTVEGGTYRFVSTTYKGDVARIIYQVGERTADRTVWGGCAVSHVILDTVDRFTDITGTGTRADPFLIGNYEQLKCIGLPGTRFTLSRAYRLVADIDASASCGENDGSGFLPVGSVDSGFTGQFHGGGYSIRNLCINRPATDGVGLFSTTDGDVRYCDSIRANPGKIENLGLENCLIRGNTMVGGIAGRASGGLTGCRVSGCISGNKVVGGLAGYIVSDNSLPDVTDCFTHCTVTADSGETGGLAGIASHCTVMHCFATGVVESGGIMTGGLLGGSSNGTVIDNCYTTGSVTGTRYVGGLAGRNREKSVISQCYSTARVSGTQNTGGIVGINEGGLSSNSASRIKACYFAGRMMSEGSGAIFGNSSESDSVRYCYWDIQTSGMADTAHFGGSVSGVSTETLMKMTLSGFDFDGVWQSGYGRCYPGLRSVDDASFAFGDTVSTTEGRLDLAKLLANDYDIETGRDSLVARIMSAPGGTTDSATWFAFTPGSKKGTVTTLHYRAGERRGGDTLWGNITSAVVTLDITIGTIASSSGSPLPKKLGLNIVPASSSHTATVLIALPAAAEVTLMLFDLHGRRVAVPLDRELLTAGYHTRPLPAGDQAPGVYLYRLQAGKTLLTKTTWQR